MKYNLKNRPTCTHYSDTSVDVDEDIEEWFAGFEKELLAHYHEFYNEISMGEKMLVREILGDIP